MGLQDIWGPLIAWYLFLAGVGAGAYIIGVISDHLGGSYQALVKPAISLGAPLVAIGSILLLLDLGAPLRFWRAYFRPQSSMISVGIIIITVFIILGLVHLGALYFPGFKLNQKTKLWLGRINSLFALGTAIYTGLLLGVVKAIPFWNSSILPLLFCVSAISTGIGAVLLVVGLQRVPVQAEESEQLMLSIKKLSRVDIFLVILELLVLFFYLFITASSGVVAAESVNYLVSGGYAAVFWLGVVVVGLLVPAALESWSVFKEKGLSIAKFTNLSLFTSICLLIGGLLLRYSVLAAGLNFSSML